MKSFTLTVVAALAMLSNLSVATASPAANAARNARIALEARDTVQCQTCDPKPSYNKCDITTSCITLPGYTESYCACRAGYKAYGDDYYYDDSTWYGQFRLSSGSDYVNRVYVATGTPCDVLCDDPWGDPNDSSYGMCSEVPLVTCAGY